MITETCPCGGTFTFEAKGTYAASDEALAAGAWRKGHKCNPRPPQEINLTTSVSAEVAATLVALLEDARRRGDLA